MAPAGNLRFHTVDRTQPGYYIARKFEKLSKQQPHSEVKNIHRSLNAVLRNVYLTELRGLSYWNYPFGVNILAIAKKR